MANKNIVTKLKRCGEIQVNENYLTNGHWLTHRGVFIQQGLQLDKPETDIIVLRGMGIDVREGEFNAEKVLKVTAKIEYNHTSILYDFGEYFIRAYRCLDNDNLVWIQESYLNLFQSPQVLYGNKELDPVFSTNITEEQFEFCIMPVKSPIDLIIGTCKCQR